MKLLRIALFLVLVLALLGSCSKEDALGKYGESYVFNYHYAMTPNSMFFVNNSGVVRVSKNDFSKIEQIAERSALGSENPIDRNAEIVGISSKWLFVNSLGNVYKLSHNGETVEKILESVESACFHNGNGLVYFTKNNDDGVLSVYSFDLEKNKTVFVQASPSSSDHWYQMPDGAIALQAETDIAIYPDGRVEEREVSYQDRAVDMGRDPALDKKIRGFMEEFHTLLSYAELGDYIYYLDVHPLTKVTSLVRTNKNGTDSLVLDEDTELVSIFSYNNTLYGDIDEYDAARLVTVDEKGVTSKTAAITTGAGQWGHVEIVDGFFVKTYDSINVPFLRYIYNPATDEVLVP